MKIQLGFNKRATNSLTKLTTFFLSHWKLRYFSASSFSFCVDSCAIFQPLSFFFCNYSSVIFQLFLFSFVLISITPLFFSHFFVLLHGSSVIFQPLLIPADLVKEEDTKRLIDTTVQHYGKLNILVTFLCLTVKYNIYMYFHSELITFSIIIILKIMKGIMNTHSTM